MNPDSINTKDAVAQRIAELPKVIQNAIASSEIEKHLQKLATTHKLHLDQWQTLENEVMLALLGFQPIDNLEKNISQEIGIPAEAAHALATDINTIVFEPIREELERQLEHPAAQEKEVSAIETARTQELASGETAPAPTPTPSVVPATPPTPIPEVKVARPSESSSYKPGEASSTRAVVHDDPYREPPV